MTTYAERRADRQDRIDARADAAQGETDRRFKAAKDAVAGIPFGQPILVGHYSEKGMRADLAKCDRNMRAGCEAADKAARIASVNPTTAVLVTDDDAPEMLAKRIAKAEAQQAEMKAVNVLVRKGDRAGLTAMGISEATIGNLFTPQWGDRGPLGIPAYALTNNNANIRRMKDRLAQVVRAKAAVSTERMVGDVMVEEDAEAQRIRLRFPGKPAPDMIAKLKANGFRWAPSEGAWQRQLTNAARYAVGFVLQ
jgi:hypothetical protein